MWLALHAVTNHVRFSINPQEMKYIYIYIYICVIPLESEHSKQDNIVSTVQIRDISER